jgi:hypothetical protein
MFPGSPAPLLPGTLLHVVLRLAGSGRPLGAWVRGCRRMVTVRGPGARVVVAGADLGALLRRCDRVVVRDGTSLAVVPASRLIQWRVLEVVLGTPYLPPPPQLRALFPALRATAGRLAVPLGLGSAEEALAACAAERVAVVSSSIVYHPGSG